MLIGGGAYTVSHSDVVKHFAADTGLTQEQAEQYVNEINEDELVSFDQMGSDFITDGQKLLNSSSEVDCANYVYEWEATVMSCLEGKAQLAKLAQDSTALGQAYTKLASDSASRDDISNTIRLIDQLNVDFQLEIVNVALDWATVDEARKTNSYNKAILKAALESE